MEFTTIKEQRSKEFDLWIGQDTKDKEYVAVCFVKVPGGIRHLIMREKKLNPQEVIQQTRLRGCFSSRPYMLAQGCDGSIETPVYALYISFCNVKGLDHTAVYCKAYPDGRSAPDEDEVISFAQWQGVTYPPVWNEAAFNGLIESLTAINYHSLVGELCELNDVLVGGTHVSTP